MEYLDTLHLNDISVDEMKIFNRLRSLISVRKIKSIPQKAVAEKLGVDPRIVNKFEKRYASIKVDDFASSYIKAIEELLIQEGTHNE